MDLLHLSVFVILSTMMRCSNVDADFCPKGARIDRDVQRCYWMSQSLLTWQEARSDCLKVNGGDFALVDKPSVQKFLENSFRLEAPGMVWLRDKLSSLSSAANPNHEDRQQETCPRMSLSSGEWTRSLCTQRHYFICGKQISGWTDDDSSSAQMIYALQVAQCENASNITVMVTVEDNAGAKVTAIKRNLVVMVPNGQDTTKWLKKKSQEELWALLKQGNPQDVIPYAMALTSQLNQVNITNLEEFKDKVHMRGNVTQALASLSVSSLQDAAQISSALADSTAVTTEIQCGECTSEVVETVEKMIDVIREQTRQGDVTPLDTGRNILKILSNFMSVRNPANTSGLLGTQHQDNAISAFHQVGQLMRSLMWSRLPGEEALILNSPKINAVGKRGDPSSDLLRTDPSSPCHFHIPLNLSSQLSTERGEVIQIILVMESREVPFVSAADPPISTTLAAMEFATPQGLPVPIANLTAEHAIRVTLQNKKAEVSGRVNVILGSDGDVNFTVKAVETQKNAGLFITFNFSLIEGIGKLKSGKVQIIVTDEPTLQWSHKAHVKELNLTFSSLNSSVEETVFLTPLLNGSSKDLYVTLKNSENVELCVSVCVFSSLCQFFNMEQRRWSTAGLSVLSTSSPDIAHCLTKHLTLFGASLFVHPEAIILLAPSDHPSRNTVVGIVCGVLLLIHLLVGLIAHKLDHLESTRLRCIPLCGQQGRHRYRVLVKTGWYRGAGTSAHVGISLHGVNKSGSRHLQREGAFQRNSLDDFQIETDVNLGEIWKICIWHDNTGGVNYKNDFYFISIDQKKKKRGHICLYSGLDPSWYLQHVTVWDMQTNTMFVFMVEDWLSVENEKNSGLVQKVVLATCPPELCQFGRILRAQLRYGLQDHHLWLSLWERPAHSAFSRAQRVTCCALILHLYLAAGTVCGPVADRMTMTMETIPVGMTIAALVSMEISLPPSPVSDMVEMDVYLRHPDTSCASFLSMPTDHRSSTREGSSFVRLGGVDQWTSSDSIFVLAETMGPTRLLKRKRALLQLRLNSPTSELSTSEHSSTPDLKTQQLSCSEPFSPGDASSGPSTSDSGRFSPNGTVLSDTLESSSSEWMDASAERSDYDAGLYKSHCSMSVCSVASTFLPSLPPDSFSTTSNTHIVDPEVEDRLAQETVVTRICKDQGVKVRPLCGYSLLHAKEEARKVRILRNLMKNCLIYMLFLLVVLIMNYQHNIQEANGRLLHPAVKRSIISASSGQPNLTALSGPWPTSQSCVSSEIDEVLLGNSSFFTSHILSGLKQTHWITAETQAVLVEFTQYHRETGIFLPVSILLEKSQTQRILSTVSIQSFHIPGSFSGLDLNIAITVLLLIFSVGFLSAELWWMLRERVQYLTQGWRLFQLLVSLLSFSAASLRFCFLSTATKCLSGHFFQPDTFTRFHSIAALAKSSSQLSAVVLMLLLSQMVGSLQFVRRWVMFGKVFHQAFYEICGVVFLSVLLLLLFSHTGSLLFSASVEGFMTVRQASQTLLCLLRNRIVVSQLAEEHPMLGPLFCFTVLGLGFWILGRLCGAILLQRYKSIREEMYRPSMEPQDYEMVEFLIKRLKLWMGLSKAKEFRHRVKFEGMESPPSRSSQSSRLSGVSFPVSPPGPRLVSSASSEISVSSTVSESHEVQQYVERLLPSVESLLAGFDRVNQLTDDVLNIEEQLQKLQSRIVQSRRKKIQSEKEILAPTPKLERPNQTSFCMGPEPFQNSHDCNGEVRSCRRGTHSESSLLGPSVHLPTYLSATDRWKTQTADTEIKGFPRRRAWHSGSCHSADTIQRLTKSQSPGVIPVRPRSEERDWNGANDGMPIKKRAWHSDPSEIEKD
ncbi:Polycystin-1 [Bagarius yarrelli]|uniref:Polycystin-1 n=1 Tax=Bagarius yarrelli TaxID=175774 RepID=A0A556VW85_BAGYA|nr:Polycystin-1 [Bagarius yarrelli]